MVIAIALALWAFAALPVALVLGRLCRATEQPQEARANHSVDLREKILTS
ncbi:hypothetical protein [Smaragdicoccus niigatensis]|nr:hypothetical protein [Smaragdicoccus niigatensis]